MEGMNSCQRIVEAKETRQLSVIGILEEILKCKNTREKQAKLKKIVFN